MRAFETARQIGLVLGLEPIVIHDLREQSFGIYHGRPYTELYGAFAAGSADRWALKPDGGENLRDVATRAGAALDQIALRHLGVEVVVVSHGGVMSALRGWVSNDYATAAHADRQRRRLCPALGPRALRGTVRSRVACDRRARAPRAAALSTPNTPRGRRGLKPRPPTRS